MKRCFTLFLWRENKLSDKKSAKDHPITIKLHKEELQVSKKWIETADVKIYKKSYTEEKQILVPIRREELIIEKKKMLNTEGEPDPNIDMIRIPLSEERIEITLHPTLLEDVEIYKNQYEEIQQIIETVQEEKLHIETLGEPKIIMEQQSE